MQLAKYLLPDSNCYAKFSAHNTPKTTVAFRPHFLRSIRGPAPAEAVCKTCGGQCSVPEACRVAEARKELNHAALGLFLLALGVLLALAIAVYFHHHA